MKLFTTSNSTKNQRLYYQKQGAFESKKSAFDYFFLIEGKDMEEAAKLAEQIAQVRGVPDVIAPPPTGLDKAINFINQIQVIATENPQVTDFVVSALTGGVAALGGVFAGKKLSENTETVIEKPVNIDLSAQPKEIE